MHLSPYSKKKIREQILHLLRREHKPYVDVRESMIPGANEGVFTTKKVSKNKILCLYPGVFTPGLPLSMTTSSSAVYLVNSHPEEKQQIQENAYLLNLNDNPSQVSGYLDASASPGSLRNRDDITLRNGSHNSHESMEINPSACAHKVNHGSKTKSNVDTLCFRWDNVLSGNFYSNKSNTMFNLPNTLRSDGSPWFFDGIKIHYFDSDQTGRITAEKGKSLLQFPTILCGAAFYAKEDISSHTELLLHYGLKGPPYPKWAEYWYEP